MHLYNLDSCQSIIHIFTCNGLRYLISSILSPTSSSIPIPVSLTIAFYFFFTLTLICFLFLLNSLYSKGRVLGYERAKRNQNEDTSLIQIEGVQTTKDAQFYLGKRIAYVYRAKKEVNGSKIRVIWGRVTRAHGGNGVVKAKFRSNLPPKTFGASVRVVSETFSFIQNTSFSISNMFAIDALPLQHLS
jgi:large subunit ribosomal protein L35Ae